MMMKSNDNDINVVMMMMKIMKECKLMKVINEWKWWW